MKNIGVDIETLKQMKIGEIKKLTEESKNAQMIIDNCNKSDFNPRQFRKEMNISFLINEVRKQFNEI